MPRLISCCWRCRISSKSRRQPHLPQHCCFLRLHGVTFVIIPICVGGSSNCLHWGWVCSGFSCVLAFLPLFLFGPCSCFVFHLWLRIRSRCLLLVLCSKAIEQRHCLFGLP